MTAGVLAFLNGHPGRIALFEAYERAVLACGESEMAVTKSQISWGNPYKFAFFSLPSWLGKARREAGCAVATFGLNRRVDHPRIFQAMEPYPGRWTHHVILAGPEDVDGVLRSWLAEAYAFAQAKRRKKGGG